MTHTTRRDALKALAAASGAVTIASLPTRWTRPVVQVGAVPAHAQTSCLGSLTIILLSEGNATAGRWQGPAPDSQTGPPIFGLLEITNAVDVGYSATWNCQQSCLSLRFSNVGLGATSWEIEILGQGTFPINIPEFSSAALLINLSTGAYSTAYISGLVSGCDWVEV